MGPEYELTDGRRVPVWAEHARRDYVAYVLHEDDDAAPWLVTWTDGINHWLEEYELPWHAYARLAALVAASEQQVFLVHDGERPDRRAAFVEEAERFITRTVHAFNCPADCDGTDPRGHWA